MDVTLRCNPGSGVDRGAEAILRRKALPNDSQGDRIFGIDSKTPGDARRSRREYLSRPTQFANAPLMKVDVVGVEVVGDVAADARPRLECLELKQYIMRPTITVTQVT